MLKLSFKFSNACAFRRLMSMMSSQKSDVLFENLNNAGIITLNRPKVLNALNISMTAKIFQKLQEWENTKTCVIIKGAGDKAFCAGGDVKEIIAIISGMTMGGGLGLSIHGRYRVATETTVAAMPETKIGTIPDVGSSYFLPRMPGNFGLYLALTGNRLKGENVVKSGIATHLVPTILLQELESRLSRCSNEVEIQALLSKFNESSKGFSLAENLKDIDYCFAARTVEEIFKRLLTIENEWSSKTLETLRSMCPGALKITLREMQRGAHLELDQCLKMEYRVSCRSIENHDFPEGVRALLLDKDNDPKWNPSTLAEVTDEYVESFFKVLPEDEELKFFDSDIK